MKKAFLVALGLLVGEVAVAQKGQKIIGLQVGSYARGFEIKEGNLKGSGGIYFDYDFSENYGIRTSIIYAMENGSGYQRPYNCISIGMPQPITYKMQLIEIPLNYAVNLNYRDNTAWKTNILFGYTFSYLAAYKYWSIEKGEKIEGKEKYSGSRNRHFCNFGGEVKHNLNKKYNLAFNPGLRLGVGDSYPASFLFFNLKFGQNI
jgi:hypothetical protein